MPFAHGAIGLHTIGYNDMFFEDTLAIVSICSSFFLFFFHFKENVLPGSFFFFFFF